MWSLSFWKQTAERAIRTAAQVALSFWVVGETGILEVDWVQLGLLTQAVVAVVVGLTVPTEALVSQAAPAS